MPTVTANGISIYYERRGAGRRCCSSTDRARRSRGAQLLIDAVHERVRRRSRTTSVGSGQTEIPPAVHDGRLRGRRDRAPRRTSAGTGRRSSGSASAAWSRRSSRSPCRSASNASHCCARRRAARPAPRIRCTSSSRCSPDEQAAKGTRAPRHALHARVARRRTRPTAAWPRCSPAASAPRSRADDAARRGGAARGAAAATTSHDRLGAITCPTFVAPGRFDGIAPPPNGEAIASRVPGARAAHLRGRPRVLRAGPGRVPGDPRLPRRLSSAR